MHRKRIKSLLALSLCAVLTSQNVMFIANAEEVDKNLENKNKIMQSDELQLQSQEDDYKNELTTEDVENTEESTIEDVENAEELTKENIETTSDESYNQVDPEQNKTYSMGGGFSKSTTLDNLETVKLTNPNSIGCGTVTADSLNVRSGSSTSHEIIGTLKLDETVDITGKSNGWYKINFKGKEGYIHAAYLELKPIEKGIDVSKWNGDIDWKSVKDAGADYVIIRAGFGSSTVDEKFYQNIKGARDAGLKIGIYWFSYATSVEKAKAEAQKCIEVISEFKENITYPVFFDYEYASRDYAEKQGVTVTKELATEMANTFINTIKSAGYVTGIYTNKDFGNKYFSEDVINSNNLWVAQYASKNTYGRAYDMWQYTENGSIAGVSGKVDLNYTCLIPKGVNINIGENNSGNDNNGNNNESKPSIPTEKGVTTVNLNLRVEASTSSEIITTIPKGQTIEILEKLNSGWYKVNYNGKTGYVSSSYVSINGDSNENGEMQTGWINLNGKWYYLNSNGEMQTGWINLNGKWYYLNDNGVMVKGWINLNGKWYYLNDNGVMVKGWISLNGKWYYLNDNGVMVTGWINLNGEWYYLNSSGVMVTGWLNLNGTWYYMYASGKMATNITIDGWKIGSNGVATLIK